MTEPALVLVTTSYPIAGDGSEAAGSFVADLVMELANKLPVRVVAPGRNEARERVSERIEIFRYAAPTKPLSTLKPWNLSDAFWAIRVLRNGSHATMAAVAAGATAHVLALWGLPSGEWARRATRPQGVGYSVWLLGSDVWTLGRLPIARSLLARVLRNATHRYADGHRLATDAHAIGDSEVEFLPSTRAPETRLAPVPPRQAAPYRLLFLGRWHSNKGVDILLDALSTLGESDWKHIETIDIAGGGPLHDLVHARIAALRAAGRPVHLHGFLAKHEAEAAISNADWVLIPSRIESIPLVFSDAMRLGRPVICSPVGDLPVVAKDVGIVARNATPDDWRDAIRTALTGIPPSSAAIAARAAEFSLTNVANRLRRVWLSPAT